MALGVDSILRNKIDRLSVLRPLKWARFANRSMIKSASRLASFRTKDSRILRPLKWVTN